MNKFVMAPLCVVLLLIVAAVGIIVPSYFEGLETFGFTRLETFSSYEEMRSFLNASWKAYYGFSTEGARPFLTSSAKQLAPVPRVPRDVSGYSLKSLEYSLTNVQVEGVDEADIVKTDGEYIYVMSERNVTILRAYPATEAEILSRIKADGTLRGIFINGDKLAVFEEIRSSSASTGKTSIKVYDVADRLNPILTMNVSVDGSYFNSRMIGDFIYAIVDQAIHFEHGEVALPKLCCNDQSEEVSATQIHYSNIVDRFDTFLHVIALNVQNKHQEVVLKTFLIGTASTMYVSQGNIYLTFSVCNSYDAQQTVIHRISIDKGDIDYQASGEVPGCALNQFSMDEFSGYFRIATTTGEIWGWGEATSKNHVYILNMNLEIAGRLEDLAPGERLHSARFMGDRGYLVTFKKIDPLFVLDLSVPSDPRVLGELEVTGYSDYLHPYDETHIIGVGKETVEGEGGNFAWYQGVKISLFDVSDVGNPKEISKYEIGDRGTDSPILRDHKAFLFDKARNLLVMPVAVAEIDPSKYPNGVPSFACGELVWDGAYVFSISLEEGLVLRGRITHLDSISELSDNRYLQNSLYSVKRSLYIDDVLYTVSSSKIKMNLLSDLSEIGEVNLSQ